MIAAVLLACASTGELQVDRARDLGTVTIGARTWSFGAELHAWHYPAGVVADEGFALPHDVDYVSFRISTPDGRVRGDADHTWTFHSLAPAEAAFDAMSLEACGTDDRAAFRVGPTRDGPWRWLLAVGPGGAAGLLGTDAPSCGAALDAFPSAEVYLTAHAAHPDLCAHLVHLRRRPDAIRCLLRQAPDLEAALAERDDLPNAMNDPGFDEDLLEVLATTAPADAGFAPYRVVGLLPELDPDRRRALATTILGHRRALTPWEAALVAAVARRDEATLAGGLRARVPSGTVEARVAGLVLGVGADDPLLAQAPRPSRGWTPPGLPPGPPCDPQVRPEPTRCP